jgi:hypothetical protein
VEYDGLLPVELAVPFVIERRFPLFFVRSVGGLVIEREVEGALEVNAGSEVVGEVGCGRVGVRDSSSLLDDIIFMICFPLCN